MVDTDKYIPTGNEMISIPRLRERDAAIESVTFLHMGYKGMIEIAGDELTPLLKPFIEIDAAEQPIHSIRWEKQHYWIPGFSGYSRGLAVKGTILAPIGERGFAYRIEALNQNTHTGKYTIGMKGCWSQTKQSINVSKPVNATKYSYKSDWNNNLVFDLRSDVNIFSFAAICDSEVEISSQAIDNNNTILFTIGKSIALEPGEKIALSFYWGFGYEEVSAATSAKEMLRKGYSYELDSTCNWLDSRKKLTGDTKLDQILNSNLFFNFFYASGITMDTEEFVLVTSRSPRYYVSAAYWDRDSLFWSFPSILITDPAYAKNMLEYVFSKQIRNVGVHSRYIDGTVLEPGFELDELCAPIIALHQYLLQTHDYDILNDNRFTKGIEGILITLDSKKHSDIDLYETFLQPTDDLAVFPYITYNNVLVWKVFQCLSEISKASFNPEKERFYENKALLVHEAIWSNCVVNYHGSKVFAWSMDLKGGWNVYDEPPGSLQLLPFYGFCSDNDEVYKNTVHIIRDPEYPYSFSKCSFPEIGCAHAPHPWVLSIANSLLCGRKDHCRNILIRADMDNGLACESIDENTGECITGAAFASCAGFLAYAIYKAFGI